MSQSQNQNRSREIADRCLLRDASRAKQLAYEVLQIVRWLEQSLVPTLGRDIIGFVGRGAML